jgi:hypothetical protein
MKAVRTWFWVPLVWVLVYASLMTTTIILSAVGGEPYVLTLFVVVVPIVVIPLTYRKLVGGACSLRFHICALVKGILVGFVFVALSLTADTVLWSYLLPLTSLGSGSTGVIYQVWLFSATIGGFGARIAEVRGEALPPNTNISIVGYE